MLAVLMLGGMPAAGRAQIVGGRARPIGSGCPGMSLRFARSGEAAPVVGVVQDSSPAARAGLAAGDELLAANGAQIATMRVLHGDPGTVVRLTVKRGTVQRDVDFVFGRLAEGAVTDSSSGAKPLVPRCIAVERLRK